MALAGLIILAGILLVLALGDLIAPYAGGIRADAAARLEGPGPGHPFGTDEYGRDLFTRVIHGGRISLALGITATALAMGIALVLGATAGYFGGAIDTLITGIVDTLLCIPPVLFSLAILTALGPGFGNLLVALVVSHVPGFTRLVRSVVLTIAENDYLDAARAFGSGGLQIIRRHVIPNALGPLIVQATLSVARIILIAAGLSFIGLGVRPPAPEWGAMLAEARVFLRRAPHLMIFPAAALALSSLSLNLLGDGLRDALDIRFEA
jgi:peptide/nickel transport system permease protein